MELTWQIYTYGFVIAAVMGAVANKTNFCTMGAISDWVNMGDTGRFRAWMFAISVAILGVLGLEILGITDMSLTASNDTAQPPYRIPNFVWPRYIIGGILFGIGMTLASGCGNKTVLRIGGGNLKSLVVFLVMGAAAYLMLYTSFDYYVFLQWMTPVSPNLSDYGIPSQDLGAILAHLFGVEDRQTVYYFAALLLGVALLIWAWRSSEFRGRFDNVLGGLVVGGAIVAAWYVTAGPMGQAWLEEVEFMDTPPRAYGAQSYTFVAPSGQTLYLLITDPANSSLITFAMMAVAGVLVGSFIYALVSRSFRLEWFVDRADAVRHVIGGVLMGVGGVLGMGCTFGQGITGFSTLAVGSIITFLSICLGSALTMKVQYYKLVYEEEATFGKALVTALVDLRLLPGSLRKLDAV